MNRALFCAGAVAAAATPARTFAASPLTIVCATCTNGDDALAVQLEDQLAEALIDRGVRVADPSAIAARYHEAGRAAIGAAWGEGFGAAAFSWASVSWIESVYHARRLFAAQLEVRDASLPYGEFKVHDVTTRLSYRCYDVVTHQTLAAGSVSASARGEDAADCTDDAVASAIKSLAPTAATRLNA